LKQTGSRVIFKRSVEELGKTFGNESDLQEVCEIYEGSKGEK